MKRLLFKFWMPCFASSILIILCLLAYRHIRSLAPQSLTSPELFELTLHYCPRNINSALRYSGIDKYALSNYALSKIIEPFPEDDFQEFGRRVRVLKDIINQSPPSAVARALEHQLFPFLTRTKIKSVQGVVGDGTAGIVITTGDLYFPFVVHTIRSLRFLNCTLPVEVWYSGSDDLTEDKILFLQKFHDVEVRDLKVIFQASITSWDCKPFAVSASRFSQVLLMDADAVFVRNPMELFYDYEYIETGALFFKDRSLFPGEYEKSRWIINLFPEPISERIQNLRMLQAKSQYEQESGVVLIDKRRHFIGISTICALNWEGPKKNIIRENTHGEKESFWIGLELANEKYSFIPSLPGSIGQVNFNEDENAYELCGKLAHFNRAGKLLWFNDAIAASKLEGDPAMEDVTSLTQYAKEGECEWVDLCMRGGPFHDLSPQENTVIDRLHSIYRYSPFNRQGFIDPLEELQED